MNKSKYNISDEETASRVEALNNMLDGEETDLDDELKAAAWNILHENPGTDFDGWVDMLFEMYPCEIVDALGADEQKVMAQLSDMWHKLKYSDGATGLCMTYSEWAEYFSTTQSVEAYDLLSIHHYRTFDF